MRRRITIPAVLLASALGARPAHAHRLDEYLQATTIAVARDRVTLQLRLTPGVAVFARVFADVDANRDGIASPDERRAYAERVLRDLSFTVDGDRRPLRLVAVRFPDADAMREGRGEMVLDVDAAMPNEGGDRRLTFENRHQRAIGVYLVNALVPRDSAIRITAQQRTPDQSRYELRWVQAGASTSNAWPWIAMAALLPVGWLVCSGSDVRTREAARRYWIWM